MTQEQIMRRMLQGFVDDPPDNEYQEGYLAALSTFANEVMGFEWNDPLLTQANEYLTTADVALDTDAKVRPALMVIDGGKPHQ